MYKPTRTLEGPETFGFNDVISITLKTGSLKESISWFIPPKLNNPIIVYFHGNSGNISNCVYKVEKYIKSGFGVFLVGYSGFGANSGVPTEKNLNENGLAAINHLINIGHNTRKIILYGESLGTAIAIDVAYNLAKSSPALAVILEAPFSSMIEVAKIHYWYLPVNFIILDRYESVSKVSSIKSPLLVLHGDCDKIVPIRLAVELFSKAKEPKYSIWIKGAEHGNLYDFNVSGKVLEFIKNIKS